MPSLLDGTSSPVEEPSPGLLKAVWHCLPELMKWFGLKGLPFQSCPSFRMNALNFKEALSNSLYVAQRSKLNYAVLH
jgi:hypothetical protein